MRAPAVLLVAISLSSQVFATDVGAISQPPSVEAVDSSEKETTLEDGERDWGRDPGIGTTLEPRSMIILGFCSAVVLGLVIWLVSYRKPDGTVHPYDE